MASTVYSSTPTILGTAALADGKVAVLGGFAGTYLPYASASFYYGVFDKLQVAIVAPGGSTTLQSTGLSFPAGDSPNGRGNPGGGGAIAALTSGQIAVLTWGGTSGNYDVTILNADGSVNTSAFTIGNAAGTVTSGSLYNPVGAIAALPGGGYVVAWNGDNDQQTFMKIFNSANQQVGSTITIADVTGTSVGSTDWYGSMAVDGKGNIILGFGTTDVYHDGTYKLYNSAGQAIGSGTTYESESAPIFVGLAGGGFDTASYQATGPWNTSSGYPGFNLVVQNVNTSGSISDVASVANADTTDHYAPSIHNIAVNVSGEVVFEEAHHTAYDTLIGSTLTRDALSPSTPGVAFSTSPNGDPLSGGNEIIGAAVSGTSIVGESLIAPLCFLRGTSILTPRGPVRIEELAIGGEVVTHFGGISKIKWLGRQSYSRRFAARNPAKMPVRIKAGALADGLPQRDLFVSPGHSLLLGGQLVLAQFLVNGLTVTQGEAPEQIDYIHIELEGHDCVLAEGCWAESYADAPGMRAQYHNAADFDRLYPDHVPVAALSLCAPRPEHGAALETALAPVTARAAATLVPGALQGYVETLDADGTATGWATDLAHPYLPVMLEILCRGEVIGTTLACQDRQDVAAAGYANARCGFTFQAAAGLTAEDVTLRRATDGVVLPLLPSLAAQLAA